MIRVWRFIFDDSDRDPLRIEMDAFALSYAPLTVALEVFSMKRVSGYSVSNGVSRQIGNVMCN